MKTRKFWFWIGLEIFLVGLALFFFVLDGHAGLAMEAKNGGLAILKFNF